MTTMPEIQHHLLQASRVVTRLVEEGLRVEEIRIQGRARPAVQVRHDRRNRKLHGSRYAWGQDARGRFERFAVTMDGVQVQWEVR